jgi:NAD(P)-dependent dehydrogenase (short-subunit alcohol dehydrogenase family)
MELTLSGRTVLITGASSGFGAHFARLFVAEGARVVIGARRVDKLAALAEELGDAALAVAMATVTAALERLRNLGAIDDAELLRLAYKFGGEVVDVEGLLARGRAEARPSGAARKPSAARKPGPAVKLDPDTGEPRGLAKIG